jgi:hypothetical protein
MILLLPYSVIFLCEMTFLQQYCFTNTFFLLIYSIINSSTPEHRELLNVRNVGRKGQKRNFGIKTSRVQITRKAQKGEYL